MTFPYLLGGCGNPTGGGSDGVKSKASWKYVGVKDFASSANFACIAVDNGTPYVAYQDGGLNKLFVMKYNGASWQSVGGPGGVNNISVFIAYRYLTVHNGMPYVAFSDYDNGYKVTVKRFNGSTWEVVGDPGFSASSANYTNICINGVTPEVAYLQGGTLIVMRYDEAADTWKAVGTPSAVTGSADYPSLYAYGGTTYLGFIKGDLAHKAMLIKYNDSLDTWEALDGNYTGVSTGYADNISVHGYNDDPYILFCDYSSTMDGKATVMKYDGAWQTVGSPGFSVGTAEYNAIFVHNGTPEVMFSDQSKGERISVMRFNDPTWEVVGTSEVTGPGMNFNDLFIYNGVPYIVFIDTSVANTLSVMRYK